MNTKPLFVPLKKEYFQAFNDGSKNTEYRVHGPRWNHGTCTPGRPAVLANGYGYPRIDTKVKSVSILMSDKVKKLTDFFGPGVEVIAIRMDL